MPLIELQYDGKPNQNLTLDNYYPTTCPGLILTRPFVNCEQKMMREIQNGLTWMKNMIVRILISIF